MYYFTSYSQPLASALSSSISSYFTNNVYSDGADKNRGAKYSYYHVTLQQDFPSVLIEVGFVDHIEDAMAMASSSHQKGIAKAIVNGIKNYLSRSSISYAADGSTNVTAPDNDDEEPEETTAPPEEEPEESDTMESETTETPEETTEETSDSSSGSEDTSAPVWGESPGETTDPSVTTVPETNEMPEETTTSNPWVGGIPMA